MYTLWEGAELLVLDEGRLFCAALGEALALSREAYLTRVHVALGGDCKSLNKLHAQQDVDIL